LGDIFGGQFSQPHLRFAVIHIVSMPLTFGGLISQINGAWDIGDLPLGQPHYRKTKLDSGQNRPRGGFSQEDQTDCRFALSKRYVWKD
jgi:hypothetical protein